MRWMTVGLMLLAVALFPAAAQADRAFGPRFTANTQGDIAFAANGVLTCVTAEAGCPDARNRTGSKLNNNDRVLTYIDVDADPATFNSSEATLSLPPGARVLFAGLYFGGRSSAGQGGLAAPSPSARDTARIQGPGDSGYTTVTGAVDTASELYQTFADVTPFVRARGAGAYRVANVQVGTGKNASQSHGWALIVAYGDPAAPSRNLSVFDGFTNVGSNSPGVTIPLSGFQTPPSGPVRSTVSVVTYEGDFGTTGDGATIVGRSGPTALSAAPLNAANNLFNATISRAGANVSDRLPNYPNNFGFDVDTFPTTDVLDNGQSSTQVRLTTSGDAYAPGVVTIATELFAPRIVATKTVDKAEASLGDTLAYTVHFENTGQDAAAGVAMTDAIPDGTTYVEDSLEIDGVPQTDADDTDRGEVAGGSVVARLGSGADGASGGTLAIGAETTVRFQVRITGTAFAAGARIANTARATFRHSSTGVDDAVDSVPAETRLLLPDLLVLKIHSPDYVAGSGSTILIGVYNLGEGPTAGETVVTDTLPAGLTVSGPITGDPWECEQSGQTITCRRTDPLPAVTPSDPQPIIVIPVTVEPGTPPGALSNTVTVSNVSDPNPANNSATDPGTVSQPSFDLELTKRVTSSPPPALAAYPPGVPVTFELRVRNHGIFDAPNVRLTDVLPASMDLQSANPSQGTCGGATCDLGTIVAGEEATVTITAAVTGVPARYPSDPEIVNHAEVTADGIDVDPSNNAADASIQAFPQTELSVTKDFAPGQPAEGGFVTYTMQIHNDGPGIADVSVGDLLPPEILEPELSLSGGTGDCELGIIPGDDPENPAFPDAPVCTIPQLEVGGTRTFTIRGRLAPGSAGKTVTNRVAVAGSSVEINFSDNLAEVSFVPGYVDLGLGLERLGPETVAPGEEVTFRITARNDGTAPATGVVVREVFPPGLTPISADPRCEINGQEVICRLDALGPGERQAFDVRTRAEAAAAGQTLSISGTIVSIEAPVAPVSGGGPQEAAVELTVRPAEAGGGGARSAPPPVQVTVQCQSRRSFTIRLRERRVRMIRSVEVRVAGKRVGVVRRRSDNRLVATINLRGLPRSTYRAVITARFRDGKRGRWVRSYRTCARKLPASNRLSNRDAI